MNTKSEPSLYRYVVSRRSTVAVSTFTPALYVLSLTLPESTFFSLVRTKAGPLPGLTCWKSTICHSWPSITSTSPFLKSAVLGTVGYISSRMDSHLHDCLRLVSQFRVRRGRGPRAGALRPRGLRRHRLDHRQHGDVQRGPAAERHVEREEDDLHLQPQLAHGLGIHVPAKIPQARQTTPNRLVHVGDFTRPTGGHVRTARSLGNLVSNSGTAPGVSPGTTSVSSMRTPPRPGR